MIPQKPPEIIKPVFYAGQPQAMPQERLIGADRGLADGLFDAVDDIDGPQRATGNQHRVGV